MNWYISSGNGDGCRTTIIIYIVCRGGGGGGTQGFTKANHVDTGGSGGPLSLCNWSRGTTHVSCS